MVYFPARQRPYLIFSASSAQRLNGEISEFLFTTEAQRGVAATKAAILFSPQRHSPCGIAARYSTGQEFAELGVFLNQKLFLLRVLRACPPPGRRASAVRYPKSSTIPTQSNRYDVKSTAMPNLSSPCSSRTTRPSHWMDASLRCTERLTVSPMEWARPVSKKIPEVLMLRVIPVDPS